MNEDFIQYVYERCEVALTENVEYMQMQSKAIDAENAGDKELYLEITCNMEKAAEELCYIKGFQDALNLFNKGYTKLP